MDNIKKYEKIANVDLGIHRNATSDEWERYDAALAIISYKLFKKNIGTWGGRESCIGEKKNSYIRTNYWYVLESGLENAKTEIKRIIKNFNLLKFTKLTIGVASETESDYKTEFLSKQTLKWSWDK